MKPVFHSFLLTLAFLSPLVLYQNCSEVKFELAPELASRLVCDEDGNCVFKGETVVTAGVDLPPLKMMFVVDNSYTMKANQFNLAASFNQMFSQDNSANLVLFDTTAFLFNTAQYSYPWNSGNITLLSQHLLQPSSYLALTQSQLNSQHRPISTGGKLSAKIPGDVIGYSLTANGTRFDLKPQAVMGFRSEEGVSSLRESMVLPSNSNPDSFFADFQSRLAILNPDYNPDGTNGRFFAETQDNESAMCAIARVLRNPDKYVGAGEQSVFILVTDENEADLSGSRCIQSTFKTDEDVVDAVCEERHTRLTISRPNCTGQYTTGYTLTYDYSDVAAIAVSYSNAPNGIKYKPAVSITYPNTNVNYIQDGYWANRYTVSYKKRRFQSQSTSVNYFVKTCVIRDGVVTDQCSYIANSGSRYGDWRSNCVALAQTVGGANVATQAPYAPTCTFNSNYTDLAANESCNTSEPTCRVAYLAGSSFTYRGHIDNQADCNTITQNHLTSTNVIPYNGFVDVNDSNSFPQCSDSGLDDRLLGNCPTNEPTCVAAPESKGPIKRAGNFTDSTTECNAEAKKIDAYAQANSATCALTTSTTDTARTSCGSTPDCSVNYSSTFTETTSVTSCSASYNSCSVLYGSKVDTSKTSCSGADPAWGCTVLSGPKTFTADLPLAFSAGQYLGPELAVNTSCTSEMRNRVQQVQPKFNTVSNNCKVKALSRTSVNPLTVPEGATCASAAAALCDTTDNSGSKRFCVANSNPFVRETTVYEEVNCQSLCKDSKTSVCSALSGATPDTQISAAFAASVGIAAPYSCTSTVTPTIISSTRRTLLASEKDKYCVAGTNGRPYYLSSQTSAPYRSNLPVTDYVSGSNRAIDGSYTPKSRLDDYIVARSEELFGNGLRPIVSAFVRLPADGNGVGGSVGSSYTSLATRMQGQSVSAVSGDYGGPLRELTQIISERVQRTFVIGQLKPGQEIRKVFTWNKQESRWVELTTTQFTAFNNTVTIAESVDFERGDQFKVEYW